MGSYSPERKAAVIARMLSPHSQSVYPISRQESIPVNTLYDWRSRAGISTPSVTNDAKGASELGCVP
ncbi:transposase (plasmid) [Klebsiella sp. WOUb02]|uniref:transposase n=1 Tax=Klebsiella sp. WOUb02 TaxID=3161071 RepID=UPI003D053D33